MGFTGGKPVSRDTTFSFFSSRGTLLSSYVETQELLKIKWEAPTAALSNTFCSCFPACSISAEVKATAVNSAQNHGKFFLFEIGIFTSQKLLKSLLLKHSILLSNASLSVFHEYFYICFTIFFNESWSNLCLVSDSFYAAVVPQITFCTYSCFAMVCRRATLDLIIEKLVHFVR